MRVIIQISLQSNVRVDNKIVGQIDKGLVLLVGFTAGDNVSIIDKMINKIINLRIFDDENGVTNKSLLEVGGSILSISQFTLYADISRGRRPSYIRAMGGSEASKLYEIFNNKLKEFVSVETGIFGADMQVSINNNGPVTIIIESEDL